MWNSILADTAESFWLPQRASTVAPGSDALFYAIYWICVFFFVLVTVLLVVFVIKFRHREGVKRDSSVGHNNVLEITWTLLPSIIVVFLYYYGFKQYMNMAVEPPNAYRVTVTGKMWNWSFTYPNGFTDGVLHVPPGKPVLCTLTSQDVIHGFSIPAFRIKKDVVPGRYNRVWFESNTPGTYDIYCTMYCGQGHSTMRSTVVVEKSMADFQDWLAKATAAADNLPPVERGKRIYQTAGCMQCHSIDGTRIVGPTWKDMFGAMQPMADGSKVLADEAYVTESIREPSAKIHAGYPNPSPMPPFPDSVVSERDVKSLIAFMKSISTNYHGPNPDSIGGPTTGPSTRPTSAPTTAPAKQVTLAR